MYQSTATVGRVYPGECNERLIGDAVGPAMIEHHKMSAGLVGHVLEEIVGDVRRVALFGTDSHGTVSYTHLPLIFQLEFI